MVHGNIDCTLDKRGYFSIFSHRQNAYALHYNSTSIWHNVKFQDQGSVCTNTDMANSGYYPFLQIWRNYIAAYAEARGTIHLKDSAGATKLFSLFYATCGTSNRVSRPIITYTVAAAYTHSQS